MLDTYTTQSIYSNVSSRGDQNQNQLEYSIVDHETFPPPQQINHYQTPSYYHEANEIGDKYMYDMDDRIIVSKYVESIITVHNAVQSLIIILVTTTTNIIIATNIFQRSRPQFTTIAATTH